MYFTTWAHLSIHISIIQGMYYSPVQLKNMRLEAKKPYNFDKSSKRSALSEKEQAKTTGKNNENLNCSNTYGFLDSNLEVFCPTGR